MALHIHGGKTLIKLIGILIVIIGATFEINPLLTILAAAFATGLASEIEPVVILEMIGDAFTTHRYLSIFILVLPLIGMLERRGLYEKMEADFQKAKNAAAGRVLSLYMTIRQISVALGILFVGHFLARSFVAPMALEAALREGKLLPSTLDRVKAMVVASENCGNFFGQLLFVASGGGLFVRAVMEQAGYSISLLKIVLYAIPTAFAAYGLVIWRCRLLDMALRREIGERAWQE